MLLYLISLQLATGLYIQAGGLGELDISAAANRRKFNISSLGGNGHSCTAGGLLSEDNTRFVEKLSADTPACTLTFTPKESGIEVELSPISDCHSRYCGTRASIDGLFLSAPPTCAAKAASKIRSDGQILYNKNKWQEAVDVWQRLFDQCEPFLFWQKLDWLRNDLAVGYHRLNRNEDCLKRLEPLTALSKMTPSELNDFAPADAEVKKKLAKATRANFNLCANRKNAEANQPR